MGGFFPAQILFDPAAWKVLHWINSTNPMFHSQFIALKNLRTWEVLYWIGSIIIVDKNLTV